MITNINNFDLEELAQAYADGELSEALAADVERQMETDAILRQIVQEYQKINIAMQAKAAVARLNHERLSAAQPTSRNLPIWGLVLLLTGIVAAASGIWYIAAGRAEDTKNGDATSQVEHQPTSSGMVSEGGSKQQDSLKILETSARTGGKESVGRAAKNEKINSSEGLGSLRVHVLYNEFLEAKEVLDPEELADYKENLLEKLDPDERALFIKMLQNKIGFAIQDTSITEQVVLEWKIEALRQSETAEVPVSIRVLIGILLNNKNYKVQDATNYLNKDVLQNDNLPTPFDYEAWQKGFGPRLVNTNLELVNGLISKYKLKELQKNRHYLTKALKERDWKYQRPVRYAETITEKKAVYSELTNKYEAQNCKQTMGIGDAKIPICEQLQKQRLSLEAEIKLLETL